MSSTHPTMILHSGVIHTLDDRNPRVECIAINQDGVLALGTDNELLGLAGSDTKAVDLMGRVVLPGLTDAHIHLEQFALANEKIDVEVPSVKTCLDRVQQAVLQSKPGGWVLGHGWNQNVWDRYGNLSDLDAMSPENPVYLSAKSLHAGWANSAALDRAGITANSPDPPGGRIQRDGNGVPTGILFENATQLITKVIPEPSLERSMNAIHKAQSQLWKYGITGVHDFDGSRCLQALQKLQKEHKLGLRVIKNIPIDDVDQTIRLGLRTGLGDEWIRIGNVKIFADGALGPRTAAMMVPYEGEPENLGTMLYEGEELTEIFTRAANAGLAMAVHAIGDKAVHEVLLAFEKLRRYETEKGYSHLPHRIEHLQLLHPDDIPLPARHDIIASMQPIHATSDMDMADRYWGSRVKYAYAWRSQLEAGATLAFGSDAPVESPNPFWGLYAAITRRRRNGHPDEDGWVPFERISLHDALRGYTHGPAKAAGTASTTGRLAVGYVADLIVLEKDPFFSPAEEIADLLPSGTVVGGEWRYRNF